ncbi:PLP-dependent aminotransferase family protein [Actinomadura rugatobispora]|uniref:PLP-dependent aminotransferase family protein n=1 Tax=Actinomadura rugatobispora TaxID=1994 RepID=A0ABW0ZT36_9ACTN|nr:PLP-dependent aminotransferase family protein [Actinomadura rugatobispora]
MDDYRHVADRIAAAIATGRLRPGDRLPPQRTFARRNGIAASTAARVYAELGRRGLVVGEVGRGTFVRAAEPAPSPPLTEPSAARVDLELNHPSVPGQAGRLASSLERLQRPDVLEAALRPVGPTGTPAARAVTADLLAHSGWRPAPEQILFTGNGRQAIAGAVSALVPTGGRLAVEDLTYPVIKAIAARLGVTLTPIPTDRHGLCPEALAAAHRRAPFQALYVQPTLHNPYGTTMPAQRRADLAAALDDLGVHAIEDAVWAFLDEHAPPPLAAHAPDRTILIDSLSKRLAPGLTVGIAVTPPALPEPLTTALRSGAWTPSGYALEAVTGWISDGTVAAIGAAKRADALARGRIAASNLPGAGVRGAPCSYFRWWDLPAPWRAETFVAAAAREGIAVTPGAAFMVGAGRSPVPNAVRLGLASPPPEVLEEALTTLTKIAHSPPGTS